MARLRGGAVGGAWRWGGAFKGETRGGTVGAQPGEVLEPWGGVWEEAEPDDERICGAGPRLGGGASGGGRLEETGRGGAR